MKVVNNGFLPVKSSVAKMKAVVPHLTDAKSTPFERMFGRKPDYDRLRLFGALTYFYKRPVQRESASKWTPTGTAGAFLGYQEDMKAYRIWDPSTRQWSRRATLMLLKRTLSGKDSQLL